MGTMSSTYKIVVGKPEEEETTWEAKVWVGG
jgi:hypothetical protein